MMNVVIILMPLFAIQRYKNAINSYHVAFFFFVYAFAVLILVCCLFLK